MTRWRELFIVANTRVGVGQLCIGLGDFMGFRWSIVRGTRNMV